MSVKLLGHVMGAEGIRPDPEKVRAIVDFPAPVCVTETRQFVGMANQVGRFLPNLSEKLKPDITERNWSIQQQGAFD
ncbi:uncharacterized protein ISCGN_030299 [Ixodes scapularis]